MKWKERNHIRLILCLFSAADLLANDFFRHEEPSEFVLLVLLVQSDGGWSQKIDLQLLLLKLLIVSS